MPFIVVYDANALYPNAQRDLLIRIAREGLVQAKWSDEILDEMIRSRARNHPDVPQEKLDRLRDLMNGAVADCLVSGYEDLIDGLKLPDAGDRHVLAAAIRASAQVIVTANLKHFPRNYLARFSIEARSPDAFVLDQIGINASTVASCVQQIADSRQRMPQTAEDILAELERSGLLKSVAALRSGQPAAAEDAADQKAQDA
jgi:predicted nucleic acid-binding protein